MPRKHIAPQFELPIDAGFTLISETTLDGERISRENEQRQQDREHAEESQTLMF